MNQYKELTVLFFIAEITNGLCAIVAAYIFNLFYVVIFSILMFISLYLSLIANHLVKCEKIYNGVELK